MEANIQISLPPALKEWLDRQVASKGFASPGELVEDMLRREQELQFRASIDEKLKQSLGSGESTSINAAEWERLRSLGRQRAAQRPSE